MPLRHHPLVKELPEHSDRIHQLKMNDNHFHKLMEEYEVVDKQVYRAESEEEPVSDDHLTELRKLRLHLKDQLYRMIKATS